MRRVFVVLAHGLEQERGGDLAVFVDTDVEDVVQVRLILQPGAVIGDDRGAVDGQIGLVGLLVEIDARRTDDLGDDHALGAVDDERAAGCHEREVAHEDLLFLDLLGLLVAQANADLQRGGVGGVAGFALLLGVLGLLVHGIIHERQFQIAGIVRNGGHSAKNLPEAFLQEPLVGVPLDLQQVGHILDLFRPGVALSYGPSVLYVLRHQ